MTNPQYMLHIIYSQGSTSIPFVSKEDALKLKAALVKAKNNVYSKGELFNYIKDDSEITIYLTNITCIVINSLAEYYDERYFFQYQERYIQKTIDEQLSIGYILKDLPKTTDAAKLSEHLVELAAINLAKSAKLNNVAASFMHITNVIMDSALDPGLRTQIVDELKSIQVVLQGINQGDNEFIEQKLIEKMLSEFQSSEGQNV